MQVEKNRRILVIDDNRAIHDDFRKILDHAWPAVGLEADEKFLFGDDHTPGPERYELDTAFQGEEGLAKVRQRIEAREPYAVVFVDMRMPPGWDGLTTIARIWEVDTDVQIVVCTAYSDYSWEEIVGTLGTTDRLLILKKPFDTAEVCQLACALTEKWRLARHARLRFDQLSDMVGEQTRHLRLVNEQLVAEAAERRRSELALRVSEDRYALAAAGANDGLWDADLVADRVFYSERWKGLLGFAEHEIADSRDEWFARIHPDDRDRLESEMAAHLAGTLAQFSNEHRARHKDGSYRWMLARGLAIRDPHGVAVRMAGSLTDITGRKLAEEQLRYAAHHDALTGLANRALLTDRLARCMRRARRERDRHFAVVFLDLDRFKIINDTRGHAVGDQVLIEVGRRLASNLRDGDTVARQDRDCLARLGGDEFVLLLDGLRDAADAIRVAERLLVELARPIHVADDAVHCAASIGIAIGDERYQRPDEILRDADSALYSAKAAGRGRYQVFDEAIHQRTLARWRLENELRQAIERDELTLHYQPIVSFDGDRIWEVEALVRWRHPVKGLVPPGAFISVAEETGLIVPLGAWVLRRACEQFVAWRERAGGALGCSIGVNVSVKQFAGPDFVDGVVRILEETGMAPRDLRLEITESAMMDAAATASTLGRLRELDIRLHLDDFGTGYSSLSYLHLMPIDALKIDRTFVDAMTTDPMSRSIVQAIVTLAHTIGMQVVAEGVETRAQLEQLRALGCDHAQGYLLHRPMDAEATTALLLPAARARAESR